MVANQGSDIVVYVAESQVKMNMQLYQVCYVEVRVLVEKK